MILRNPKTKVNAVAKRQTTNNFAQVNLIAFKILPRVYILAKRYNKTKEYNLKSIQQDIRDKENRSVAFRELLSSR